MAISTFQCVVMELETRLFKSWLSYDGCESSSSVSANSTATYNCINHYYGNGTDFWCNQYLVCYWNVAFERILCIFRWVEPAILLSNASKLEFKISLLCIYFFTAYKFYQKSDSGSSRKLFRFSLIHLPILMILFFVNKKKWLSEKEIPNKATTQVQTTEPAIVASTVKAVM